MVASGRSTTSPKKRCEERGTSCTGVDCQSVLDSVPPWSPRPAIEASAATFVNVTEPKLASGICRQYPFDEHSDGASAIHSAEVRSGLASVTRFEKTAFRVRFFSQSSTSFPSMTTEAVMTSPGLIFRFLTVIDGSGTSSYQAE